MTKKANDPDQDAAEPAASVADDEKSAGVRVDPGGDPLGPHHGRGAAGRRGHAEFLHHHARLLVLPYVLRAPGVLQAWGGRLHGDLPLDRLRPRGLARGVAHHGTRRTFRSHSPPDLWASAAEMKGSR